MRVLARRRADAGSIRTAPTRSSRCTRSISWWQNRRGKLPLLLWHGGGLTGVTYETKPDGQPGWLNYFLRKGWDIYVSDAMERGRSGWSDTFKGDAGLAAARRHLGAFSPRPARLMASTTRPSAATYPGVQFPLDAYEQFMKQGVPRWITTDDKIVAAYLALVDKVCPCVVLMHSQAGAFGFKVAEAAARQGEGAGRRRAVGAGRPATRSRRSRTRRSW